MAKPNYHSVPKNNDWAVKKEGQQKPISVHRTQSASEDRTRILAKQAKVEAVYHDRRGVIKDKDSFGRDPNPPKDRRH